MSEIDNEINEEEKKYYEKIYNHFTKANEALNIGDFESARDELKAFLEIEKKIIENKEDDEVIYTSGNIAEYMLCCEYEIKVKGNRKVNDPHIDLVGAYLNLGCIEVEFNNLDVALDYLDKALEYNPYNYHVRSEIIDIYKRKEDLDKVKALIEESYEFIYKPEDLARYYRDLGYYYIEKNEFELAKSLYVFSAMFDETKQDIVLNELNYIYSITHDENLPDIGKAFETLNSKNIPTFFNKENMAIVLQTENQLIKDNLINTELGIEVKMVADFYRNIAGMNDENDNKE